jgi:hypothetical protein
VRRAQADFEKAQDKLEALRARYIHPVGDAFETCARLFPNFIEPGQSCIQFVPKFP